MSCMIKPSSVHESELDENRHRGAILSVSQIRRPSGYERPRRSLVSAGRRYSARPREVRNVRVTVIKFPAERNVLAWHVVVAPRHVPRLEWVTGIFREITRTAGRGSSIDRRQQH